MTRPAIAMLAAAGVFLVAGCAGDDDGDEAAGTTTAPTDTASSVRCRKVVLPKTEERRRPLPTGALSGFNTYDVVVHTNCGRFTIRLDIQIPTRAALSFFRLAKSGFYDRTYFMRIVPNYVVQGGDPTGTTYGSAGYLTKDTVPAGTRYTKGVVAMAKKIEEPPGTGGSQFFIVTANDARLKPEFALIGRVIRGMPVVEAIGRRATEEDEHGDVLPPKNPVVIERMTVKVTPPRQPQ